jgi:hypothetical protein
VNVYLLLVDGERHFFYADETDWQNVERDEAADGAAAKAGFLTRLALRLRRAREAWRKADGGLALRSRRVWDWLHSKIHPDEAMLVRLRSARQIDLSYPASRTEDEIQGIWRDYLRRRLRSHIFWMIVNGLLAPILGVALWLIPGPNLVGYWFAYRAVHHALIVRGIWRVLKGTIPTVLHPFTSLDEPLRRDVNGHATHAALRECPAKLDTYVAWSGGEISPPSAPADEPTPDIGLRSTPRSKAG